LCPPQPHHEAKSPEPGETRSYQKFSRLYGVAQRYRDWSEEEEPLLAHARDPHKRVDVVAGSRAIRAEIDGVLLAESHRPLLLFETTLPVRCYLPPDDARIELVPSQARSVCPYKGVAAWWPARIGDRVAADIAWSYPSPVPENPRIAGLICFRNERVDLTVDGQRLERPVTPWS
jgi:uncharacterized protein (DUF427 family)